MATDINLACLKGDLDMAEHLVAFAEMRKNPDATAELCRLACRIIDPYLEIDPETVVTFPPAPTSSDDEIITESDCFSEGDFSENESDFTVYSDNDGDDL